MSFRSSCVGIFNIVCHCRTAAGALSMFVTSFYRCVPCSTVHGSVSLSLCVYRPQAPAVAEGSTLLLAVKAQVMVVDEPTACWKVHKGDGLANVTIVKFTDNNACFIVATRLADNNVRTSQSLTTCMAIGCILLIFFILQTFL